MATASSGQTIPIAVCAQNVVFGLKIGHHSIHDSANAIAGEMNISSGDDRPLSLAPSAIMVVNRTIIAGPANHTFAERSIVTFSKATTESPVRRS